MKYTRLLAALIILLLLPSFAEAAGGYLNNNNILMLPLRHTFEELGYEVRWFDGAVHLEKGENHVVFNYGRKSYLHNGKVKPFKVLPKKINSNIYISEDFVGQIESLTRGTRKIDTDEESFKLSYKNEESMHTGFHQIEGELFDPYRYSLETVEHVPILMYHMIDDPANYSGIGHYKTYLVHPDNFRSQLGWLRENGYNAVTMQELYAHWVNGEPILENPVVITFDDGYACVYKNALPELVRYDMAGSVFVCSAVMGDERYLSKKMLLELNKKGVEVGSHSMTHANLTEINLEEAEEEIKKSRAELEAIIETDVNFFSYPYGAYNSEVVSLVKESGYLGAVSTSGEHASLQDDIFRLSRIFIGYSDDLERFAEKVNR